MGVKKLLEVDIWQEPTGISEKLNAFQEDLLSIDIESEFPDRRFLVDRFPTVLRYPLSETLEIFYDNCKHDETNYTYYLREEQRFIEVIKRLWTLSPVFVQTNLADRDFEQLKAHVEDHESLAKAFDDALRYLVYEIESNEQIEILAKLSLRDKIHACFIFPETKMVVRANGLILEVYLGDLSKKEWLQLICTTHGLYLR